MKIQRWRGFPLHGLIKSLTRGTCPWPVRLLRTMPLSSLAKAFLEKELKFLSAKRGQLSKFLELQAPCLLAPYVVEAVPPLRS